MGKEGPEQPVVAGDGDIDWGNDLLIVGLVMQSAKEFSPENLGFLIDVAELKAVIKKNESQKEIDEKIQEIDKKYFPKEDPINIPAHVKHNLKGLDRIFRAEEEIKKLMIDPYNRFRTSEFNNVSAMEDCKVGNERGLAVIKKYYQADELLKRYKEAGVLLNDDLTLNEAKNLQSTKIKKFLRGDAQEGALLFHKIGGRREKKQFSQNTSDVSKKPRLGN